MTNNIFMAATGVLALFTAAPAFAQTTTNVPVGVNLTLGSACVINGGGSGTLIRFPTVANPVTFPGNLDGSNLASDGGAQLSITCNSDGSSVKFSIAAGLNDSAGVHRLFNGTPGQFVQYHVYADLSRTVEFLINGPTVSSPAITANIAFTIPLYARIFQPQINAASPGSYTDTLAGTLAF